MPDADLIPYFRGLAADHCASGTFATAADYTHAADRLEALQHCEARTTTAPKPMKDTVRPEVYRKAQALLTPSIQINAPDMRGFACHAINCALGMINNAPNQPRCFFEELFSLEYGRTLSDTELTTEQEFTRRIMALELAALVAEEEAALAAPTSPTV